MQRRVRVLRHRGHLPALQIGQLVVDVLPVGIGQEEPAVVEIVQVAVGLHLGDGGVEGCDQVGARLEDEAEVLGAERVADDLELVGVGADVAAAGGGIGEDHVDVAGQQRLHRGAEGLEQLDARVLLVAVEHVVDRGVEVGGAGLRADQQLGIGAERLGVGEAGLVGAHEHELLRGQVRVGEVDLGLALVVDGDAVHADVELAVLHRRDHGVPRRQLPVHRAVEAAADLVDRIVLPADRLAGRRVHEVERRVRVLRHRGHLPSLQIGQAQGFGGFTGWRADAALVGSGAAVGFGASVGARRPRWAPVPGAARVRKRTRPG